MLPTRRELHWSSNARPKATTGRSVALCADHTGSVKSRIIAYEKVATPKMAKLRSPVKDRKTKPFRDRLRRHGMSLVEVKYYAVVRDVDDEELCIGTIEDLFVWEARQMRDPKW